MKSKVHILATVRKPDLLPAATFIFETLRVGFPTAPVHVWGNGLHLSYEHTLQAACYTHGCAFTNLAPCSHDAWIECLIERETHPFWICDTDIAFWSSVENWFGGRARHSVRAVGWHGSASPTNEADGAHGVTRPTYAGRYEPEFHEEWTNTLHVERLHTCLMYIDPASVRAAMREWTYRIPELWRNQVEFPFIRQTILPRAGRVPIFYDTLAGLYHAAPGTAFTPAQNACFDHLGCATYADEIELEGKDLACLHRAAFANPQLARGCKKQQDEYYASRRTRKPTNYGISAVSAGEKTERKVIHAI